MSLIERDLAGQKRLLAEARQTMQARDQQIEGLKAELLKAWNIVREIRNELDLTKQKLADAVLRARPARTW